MFNPKHKAHLWKKSGYMAVLLVFTLVVSITGCGSKSEKKTSNETAISLESKSDSNTHRQIESLKADISSTSKTKSDSVNRTDEAKVAVEFNRKDPASETQDRKKYDDTFFEHSGVNPFIAAKEEPMSTFAVDVDTASYSIVRNYINNGTLPPREAVRVEEFINYFRREYPLPTSDTFSIYTEAAPSIFGNGYHLIEIGLQGKKIDMEKRKAASLTFVIDVSGSMAKENRLELVKKSLEILVDNMEETDKIGIAVYGTNGRKLLDHTSGEDKNKILKAINKLRPEGSTNAGEGLLIGYEMASREFIEGGINRVILCSDGVANTGTTKAEDILKMVDDYRARDITLTALGFGMGNYNDVLLEKLADKGDGNYAYIDTLDEARKVLDEQLTGTLQVIAKDVKAQVEFNPDKVESYRLLGYENRVLDNRDFKDNSVDAGEIGAGHAVTALYEVKLKKGSWDDICVVRIRYKDPESNYVHEIKRRITNSEIKDEFDDATPRFRFLAMVAETAEILRGSCWAEDNNLVDILKHLDKTATSMKLNNIDREFIDLVRKAVEID